MKVIASFFGVMWLLGLVGACLAPWPVYVIAGMAASFCSALCVLFLVVEPLRDD